MLNFINALKALDTNIKTTFKATKDKVEDPLKNVLYDVTKVNGSVANILIMNTAPGMKEFKSERRPGLVDGTSQHITPRKWEATLEVKREQIEDDDLGRVPAAVRKMAANAQKHYQVLVTVGLMKGFTVNLDDGKPFFDASRGNLQTGELNKTNLEAARTKLQKQVDGNNEPLGYIATTLVVGPSNQSKAEELLNAQQINGTSNTLYKTLKLVVNPRITDPSWYVLDDTEGIYPLTIAERVASSAPVSKTDLNSDKAFDRDVFSWGIRGRYDVAYVDPTLIVGSTGA